MEAPRFCRVTDVSSMKQQGQGLCFVYPANAVIQLQAGCYIFANPIGTFVCVYLQQCDTWKHQNNNTNLEDYVSPPLCVLACELVLPVFIYLSSSQKSKFHP